MERNKVSTINIHTHIKEQVKIPRRRVGLKKETLTIRIYACLFIISKVLIDLYSFSLIGWFPFSFFNHWDKKYLIRLQKKEKKKTEFLLLFPYIILQSSLKNVDEWRRSIEKTKSESSMVCYQLIYDTRHIKKTLTRILLVSDSCRKKKVKCDGDSPICGNCQSMNLECTYKDTTKKVINWK
jgi:hypothetical protein